MAPAPHSESRTQSLVGLAANSTFFLILESDVIPFPLCISILIPIVGSQIETQTQVGFQWVSWNMDAGTKAPKMVTMPPTPKA
jgi:hypothetical protein